MKINFTKKEYQTLLEVLYIADWVLHAHQENAQEDTRYFKDFEQKILALAGEFGADRWVEHSDATGNYFPSRAFIDETKTMIHQIEEFENATFWEELLERLARRDFITQYGKESILKMTMEERFEKETKIQQIYDQEFSKNGINNLVVRK